MMNSQLVSAQWSGANRMGRRDVNLHAVLHEGLRCNGVKARVRDEPGDLTDGGDLEIRHHTPLAVVGNDDYLTSRLFDHLTDDLSFDVGGNRATMTQADTVHPQYRLIGENLRQVLDGEAPSQ
jgi:hypothetical protein